MSSSLVAGITDESVPHDDTKTEAVASVNKVKTAVRHAEKNRESSCAFADYASSLAIDLHRRLSNKLDLHHAQTVLAAILIRLPPSAMHSEGRLIVAGLGLGTKVLSAELIEDERKRQREGLQGGDGNGDGDRRVRDLHAEILARRGFRRYLIEEISRVLQSRHRHENDDSTASEVLVINDETGKISIREGVTFHLYTSSQPCGNACIKRWSSSRKPKQYPLLSAMDYPKDEEVEITVEQKEEEEQRQEEEKKRLVSMKEVRHPVYHPTARKDGEIALLAKRNRSLSINPSDTTIASSSSQLLSDDTNLLIDSLTGYIHPIGTIPLLPPTKPNSDSSTTSSSYSIQQRGNVMTCSDKIAKWNILGLQGGLLSFYLPEPCYLRTIIVGRKFSEVHCRRALCCRFANKFKVNTISHNNMHSIHSNFIDDSTNKKRKLQVGGDGEKKVNSTIEATTTTTTSTNGLSYRPTHVTMLCTAVKLDDSVYSKIGKENDTQDKDNSHNNLANADFSESRCLVAWWKGTNCSHVEEGSSVENEFDYEVLDGQTGLALDVSYVDPLVWYDEHNQGCNTKEPCYISRISSLCMMTAVNDIDCLVCKDAERDEVSSVKHFSYQQLKQRAKGYQVVKDYLLSDSTHLLGAWIRK